MKLLKVSEVMSKLNMSRSGVYKLIYKNIIPSIKIGHNIRVPEEMLEEMINAQIEGKVRSNGEKCLTLFRGGAGKEES